MYRITWPVSRGWNISTYLESPIPTLPIQYVSFICVAWQLRAVYSLDSPLWSGFQSKTVPKMAVFSEKEGSKYWVLFSGPPTGTSMGGNTSIDVLCIKIHWVILAVGCVMNYQRKTFAPCSITEKHWINMKNLALKCLTVAGTHYLDINGTRSMHNF